MLRLQAEQDEVPFGQPPVLTATFVNTSARDQSIVKPIDNSTEGGRYPFYLWEVRRADGSAVRQLPSYSRCGIFDPCKVEDFVRLPPDGEHAMNGGWLRRPAFPFAEAGDYLVRLRYVLSAKEGPWGDGEVAPELYDLYANAHKGEIVSEPLRIRVRPMAERHRKLLGLLKEVRRGMKEEALKDLLGSPSLVVSGDDGEPSYLRNEEEQPDRAEPHFLIYLLTSSRPGPQSRNVMDPVVTADGTPRIQVRIHPDGTVITARQLPKTQVAPEVQPSAVVKTAGYALGLDVAGGVLLTRGAKEFQLWTLDGHRAPRLQHTALPDSDLRGAQLSPDGRWLLLSDDEDTSHHVYHLSKAEGRLRARRVSTLKKDGWYGGPAVFGPDGSLWLAREGDEQVESVLLRYRLSPDGQVKRIARKDLGAFSAAGIAPTKADVLLWGSTNDYVFGLRSVDPTTLEMTPVPLDGPPGSDWDPDDASAEVAVSRDGRTVLLGSDPFAHVWRLESKVAKHLARFSSVQWPDSRKVALSPDTCWALVSPSRQVELWRLRLQRADPATWVAKLVGAESRVTGVRFSADGKTAFATARNGQLLVWDMRASIR